MSLPRFSLQYKAIVICAVAVAMGYGMIKFLTMPRRADPSFTIRTCQVITRWPGAETQRVEQLVTFPLEEEISTLEEVDYVRSVTTTGQSVIYVTLEDNLSVKKVPQAWDRVRAKVDIAQPKLPQGVEDPIVEDDFGDTAVMLIAIYEKAALEKVGPTSGHVQAASGTLSPPVTGYTPRQLEIIADRVRDRIALLPGVARADTHGVRKEVIYLETPRGNWANIDLTISQLEDLLQARNIYASGGSIDTAASRFAIQPTGEFDAVAQIDALVVGRQDSGAPIYLKDLGVEARRGYEDPPAVLARYGNTAGTAPCVIVSFTMKDGVKVTDLGHQARRLIDDLQHRDKVVPPDVAAEVVFDESVFVDHKISDFTNNVFQAVVIVLGVALLLAGWRSASVMAAAIPFVMIISVGLSASIGIELEQMSIASLIIALGMLVDNAVVVSDNIGRLQRQGLGRVESVVQGIEQIMYPILMGTLTTVFAFLPLAFVVTAEAKEYIFSIPAVVSITLLTSWVLAISVTALMAYCLIRPNPDGRQDKTPIIWIGEKLAALARRGQPAKPHPGLSIADRYESLIQTCLRAKPLVIGGAVLLLIGAFNLPVGSEFFPDDNRDYLFIDVWLPEGASLTATDRVVREMEETIRELSYAQTDALTGNRLARMYSSIGGSGPRFALGVDPQPRASNYAQIIVQTVDPLVTDRFVRDIRSATAASIPGARIVPRKLALGPPVDSPIGIRIYGTGFTGPGFADEAELRRQAQLLKDVFNSIEGIWDVHDVWGDPGYQLDIVVDEDRAKLAGVTHASVAKTFNAYYTGHRLTTFREGDHKVPVYLRLPPGERGTIADPRSVFVEGAADKIPVDAFGDVRSRRKTTKIERREKKRMIEVRARVHEGFLANEKLAEAMPAVHQLEAALPTGYWYEIGGTLESSSESSGEMMTAFGIAVVLIILCLIVQYNSFVKPIVILMTVPMGAIGALFGLWVTGNALGFMPMLGLVSLAGIVVNAGILYIEFAETLIREKLEAKEGLAGPGQKSCTGLTHQAFHQCLAQAGRIRLMPIFLTVSTTVGGLIPLALFGGPLWEGMAYLLIFGLIIATMLTLVVLPSVYAALVEYFGVRTVTVE